MLSSFSVQFYSVFPAGKIEFVFGIIIVETSRRRRRRRSFFFFNFGPFILILRETPKARLNIAASATVRTCTYIYIYVYWFEACFYSQRNVRLFFFKKLRFVCFGRKALFVFALFLFPILGVFWLYGREIYSLYSF